MHSINTILHYTDKPMPFFNATHSRSLFSYYQQRCIHTASVQRTVSLSRCDRTPPGVPSIACALVHRQSPDKDCTIGKPYNADVGPANLTKRKLHFVESARIIHQLQCVPSLTRCILTIMSVWLAWNYGTTRRIRVVVSFGHRDIPHVHLSVTQIQTHHYDELSV